MSRIIIRLNEQRDRDVIEWLDGQENKSEAIRKLVRDQITMEQNVNDMLNVMSSMGADYEEAYTLDQVIQDVRNAESISTWQICSAADVKKYIGWTYPADKLDLIDQAWEVIHNESDH